MMTVVVTSSSWIFSFCFSLSLLSSLSSAHFLAGTFVFLFSVFVLIICMAAEKILEMGSTEISGFYFTKKKEKKKKIRWNIEMSRIYRNGCMMGIRVFSIAFVHFPGNQTE